MKKFLFGSKTSVVIVCAVLLMTGLLTACNKSNNGNANTPVAALMAFNLSPDKPAIGFRLSGNSLTQSPLPYSGFTGSYLSVYTGNRTIETFDSASTFSSSSFDFDKDKYYSLFLVGKSGTYTNLVVNDNFDSLSAASGKAYIRYINAVPDSTKPLVTVTAGGSNIFNDNAGFQHVSAFAPVTPGDLGVSMKNESSINTNRTITVEQGKVYTILLLGNPQAVDSASKVQIRFIQNGNL